MPAAPRAVAAAPSAAATGLGRIAAVVVNYRTPEATRRAVRSLVDSRRFVGPILVVDNSACEESTALAGLPEGTRYLPTPQNLGFSGGVNVGIRQALADQADAVLLVNSDATVAPDCVAALEASLAHVADAGIAGPVLRAEDGGVTSRGIAYNRRTGRMRDRALDPAPLPGPPIEVVDALSGCVMLIRRAVFARVGLFDEAYFFSFEDVDFCLAAAGAGFTSVLANEAEARHEGSRSIGADSSRRLYFAARNHLRLAARAAPGSTVTSITRGLAIVGYNTAHAIRARGGSLASRLGAVASGTRDHLAGRYGDGPARDRRDW